MVIVMRIKEFKQHSQEWYPWRSDGLGASECAQSIGLSHRGTKRELWAIKTGRILPKDISNNPHVKRGNIAEDYGRQKLEKQYGILLPICAEHESHHFIHASYDGVDKNCIPHEIKAPCEKVFQEILLHGTALPDVRANIYQVKQQILVACQSHGSSALLQ